MKPDDKMATPRQMFDLLGWTPPRNPSNRAVSWDDLAAEMGRRYEDAKRLRQQEAA